MPNVKKILNEVLDDIRSNEDYRKEIFEKLNSIIAKINKNNISAKAVLGGSGAKGTWLKNFDADIFVLFHYKKYHDKSDKISQMLEALLRKKFNGITKLHGSRDYFQIKDKKFTFEIIPILEIKSSKQAMNITDISPLHSKWVQKHKKLVNDMKLAKQFCQAQNAYGAESYLRGFSGYVCEILTVFYGSFYNLAKNSAKWQDKTIIDVQKFYKNQDVFKIINVSKLESPLIVIDPVQKERNAAAALSFEKFDLFRNASRKFVQNPSKKFFERTDLEEDFIKKSKGKILVRLKIKPLSGKIDIVGSKIQKIYEFLLQKLEKYGFKTIHSAWEFNSNADLYFILDKKPLSKTITIEGPPIALKEHSSKFKKIHKNNFVKKSKLFAIENRKYLHPEQLFKDLLNDPYVKERCSSSTIK